MFSIDLVGTFLILVGLELVLGIDNLLLISIVTERLPESQRAMARRIGLALAAFGRVGLLLSVTWITRLTASVLTVADLELSWRDLILLAGGVFLLWKSVREIHHVVNPHPKDENQASGSVSFSSAIFQILVLDIVFSLDSIITAVGLTQHVGLMIAAVLTSIVAMVIFSGLVADFIRKHPAIKILALAFLVCIGATLCIEGLHQHVPKQYLYLPMGFALGVELLQMRADAKRKPKS